MVLVGPRSFLLVCALLGGGCGGADAGPAATGTVAITANPTGAVHRGTNSFSLKLAVGSQTPGTKEHTAVEVTPWMPAMGHGAPSDPVVTEVAPGTYNVEEVEFSMPGTWELRVKVSSDLGSGTNTFKYDVP